MSYTVAIVSTMIEESLKDVQETFNKMATLEMAEEVKDLAKKKCDQGIFLFFKSDRCQTTVEVRKSL